MIKKILLMLVIAGISIPVFAQPGNFSTSLHKTRQGKIYWYNTVQNGGSGGYETLTGVPITQLGCVECHDATDANGNPYPPTGYTPDCVDCHNSSMVVTQNDCLGCHSREKYIISNNFPDVHRSAGKDCMFCHKTVDMHGNGTSHNSMFDPGAIEADCSNSGCHDNLPSNHDPHGGKLHCTSCHAQTNLACYNCHFESQLVGKKRAFKNITGFVMLVNRTKDNKVHPATFQSLSYQGKTWVAFGPSVAHTIVKTGARTCTDCHKNYGGTIPAIEDYNNDGIMQFAKWNSNDSTLSLLQGIIPIPEDYVRSFKLDFITYNGDPNDPVAPSKNWSFVEADWDGHQFLYATPLSKIQMAKLGMDTTWTTSGIEDMISGQIPTQFELDQNYPNPFNPSTTIKYSVPVQSKVNITVFDALGNEVETLVNSVQIPGVYSIEFDGSDLASGIYYCKMTTKNSKLTRKMMLLK
jgi:hypothetical protein